MCKDMSAKDGSLWKRKQKSLSSHYFKNYHQDCHQAKSNHFRANTSNEIWTFKKKKKQHISNPREWTGQEWIEENEFKHLMIKSSTIIFSHHSEDIKYLEWKPKGQNFFGMYLQNNFKQQANEKKSGFFSQQFVDPWPAVTFRNTSETRIDQNCLA